VPRLGSVFGHSCTPKQHAQHRPDSMALQILWFKGEASAPEPTCSEPEATCVHSLVGSVSSVGEGNTGSGFVVIKGVDRDISIRDISSPCFFEHILITSTTLIIAIVTITPIVQYMIIDISVFGAVIVCMFVVMVVVVIVVAARVVRVPVVVAVEEAVVQIEPFEPTNITRLDAFERTQADPQSVRSKAMA